MGEAAAKVRISEVMLPLHPLFQGCPTLICSEVMSYPLVAFHALCGVVATVPPQELLQLVPNSEIVCLSEPRATQDGSGRQRPHKDGPCPSSRPFPMSCLLAVGRLWTAICTRQRAVEP